MPQRSVEVQRFVEETAWLPALLILIKILKVLNLILYFTAFLKKCFRIFQLIMMLQFQGRYGIKLLGCLLQIDFFKVGDQV
mgnify:CR=1 FL=1